MGFVFKALGFSFYGLGLHELQAHERKYLVRVSQGYDIQRTVTEAVNLELEKGNPTPQNSGPIAII